jgi:two-component system, sensor histidine kinase
MTAGDSLGYHVVVIDDNAADRQLMQRMLERARGERVYQVTQFSDPREYLRRLKEINADCVLLDYRIPGIECVDVLRAIRELEVTESTPIIVVSGYGDEEVATRMMREGAFDYLNKDSISSDRLTLSIEACMVRAQLALEVKRQQMQLAEALRTAQEASKSKTEFLARISHEMRTPMNGIVGVSELAQQVANDEVKEYLQTIQASAEKMIHIVNDLLDVAQLEEHQVQLHLDYFMLSDCLNDVVDSVKKAAVSKGLIVQLIMAPDVPECVYGDKGRLEQVCKHLLVNAIKFSSTGERVEFDITTSTIAGQLRVHFSVRDSGIGIPVEQQQMIFKAFEQADSSIALRFGGIGLGLSIASRVVALMNGQIGVRSRPERGAEFYFSIPFMVVDPQSLKAMRGGEERVEEAPVADTSPKHVLVVEDTIVNQKLICGILQRIGYTFEVAHDGLQAVNAFKERSFDVILMDVRMPTMDGLEATRHIRGVEAERGAGRTPIIAVTANAIKGDREKFLSVGMDEYISKPYRREELVELIHRTCSRSALETACESASVVE